MATIRIPTVRDLFLELEQKLAQEPQRTGGLSAVYQFDISGDQGGKWYVNIVDGKAYVVEG